MQDAWDAKACATEFRLSCKHLLQHLRSSGAKQLECSDVSVGRQLLLFDELDRGLLKGVHHIHVPVSQSMGDVPHKLALQCEGYVMRQSCAPLIRPQHESKNTRVCDEGMRECNLRIYGTRAGITYTGEQLQAEIGTFIMAGYETTAHTLSFTMRCIASNPNVQRSIYNEMQEHKLLDKRGIALRNVEYEDLPALKYLSAVLKESMRVLPVVAAFPR